MKIQRYILPDVILRIENCGLFARIGLDTGSLHIEAVERGEHGGPSDIVHAAISLSLTGHGTDAGLTSFSQSLRA